MPANKTVLARRFTRRSANPRLVALHRALTRLKSTVTVMHTGAHPDDEQNGMLALMRFGLGMRTIVACSTRGEGGQNTLGPERGGALGVVRTRELEEAVKTIDADIVWLGFGPGDSVHDFGFSKNGEDTFARWGREVIVERLVRAYRTERPDIVIPTFLNVPGQHGHHRAMTMAAEEAVGLAADANAFPEHFAEGLTPWTVAKFYLPAWSGGGSTYDDEVPPPAETVRLSTSHVDPATGVSFDEIGEWSRLDHASQGMGEWLKNDQTDWPFHLLIGDKSETDIGDGLPRTLGDIDAGLGEADEAIAEAWVAFPDTDGVLAALARAATLVEGAQVPEHHSHRIAHMLADIENAMAVAAGIDCVAFVDRPLLPQGQSTTLDIKLVGAPDAKISLVLPEGIAFEEIALSSYRLTASADAPLGDPFTLFYSGSGMNHGGGVRIDTQIAGRAIRRTIGFETPLFVLPATSVTLDPAALIVPSETAFAQLTVGCHIEGTHAAPTLDGVEGIVVETKGEGFSLSSAGLAEGRYTLSARLSDTEGFAVRDIAYPHIGEAVHIAPAQVDLLALELNLPTDRRVAYIGGGADTVAVWLKRMGFAVTELDRLPDDLSKFPAIVIGIFAFGLVPDLAARSAALHRYVEAGGNLVTLYHRPWDGWDPDAVPPKFLRIGQPSLRWRVTNPDADVTILEPDHPLIAGVNAIARRDFAGWDKERGLYFASEWDDAYVPLLAMSDAGEAPLEGALLSAKIGKGRHTHTSLVLHHQLDKLVPGAFRLMANLVAGGRS